MATTVALPGATRLRARLVLVLVAALAVVALAACSDDSSSGESGGSGTTIDTSGGTIIDVRTPGEYADGHLESAVNIDIQGPDFEATLDGLDKGETYFVYCQSGNRSARAVERMGELGFTDVVDLGGVGEAADATGIRIVQLTPGSPDS